MTIPGDLQSGDCLLYKPGRGLFGWLISIKTWHAISHCEGYVGDGWSVASRDGQGVGRYRLRTDGLAYVLRPRVPLDLDAAMAWFRTVEGQKYDWLGLLRFTWRKQYIPGSTENRQFCSEFLARWYRAGGVDAFNGGDCDAIAPSQFLYSPLFHVTKL